MGPPRHCDDSALRRILARTAPHLYVKRRSIPCEMVGWFWAGSGLSALRRPDAQSGPSANDPNADIRAHGLQAIEGRTVSSTERL
jgi:hypothetical protein